MQARLGKVIRASNLTDAEIVFIMDAIELTASNYQEWMKDYTYDPGSNEYSFKGFQAKEKRRVEGWFNVCPWNNPQPLAEDVSLINL